MEIQVFPVNAIQQARRPLLVGGVVLGSLGCLTAVLVFLVTNPILILVSAILAGLGILGLCSAWLVRLYQDIPAVQEKKELEKRLAAAASEQRKCQKNPQQTARIPAIQHRQQRIQAQLAPYRELRFLSFVREAAGSSNSKAVRGCAMFAVFGLLAACCMVGYSLLPAGDPAVTPLPVASQVIALAASSTIEPARLTDTPTASVTATLLPTQTETTTPSPLPSATPTSTETPQSTSLPISGGACLPPGNSQEAQVLDVLDGDTIEVRLPEDQQVYRVRYIGVDSPEPGAAFASEASAANAALVADQTVLLVRDVSEVDRYGRLLRYVLVGSTFVNYELVRLGLATAVNYPPDEACANTFLQAESDARATQAGWYAPGALNPFAPSGSSAAGSESGSRPGCSAAYPDICIPPPPPDLDCADVSARRFRVLPPDPHHFDGDGDGIGCES